MSVWLSIFTILYGALSLWLFESMNLLYTRDYVSSSTKMVLTIYVVLSVVFIIENIGKLKRSTTIHTGRVFNTGCFVIVTFVHIRLIIINANKLIMTEHSSFMWFVVGYLGLLVLSGLIPSDT